MNQPSIIGVDLGGTKVQAARLKGIQIEQTHRKLISSQGAEEQILQEAIATIEAVWSEEVAGIGMGIPSIVDVEKGIVYDVQNIPSWKEVHVKEVLETHFKCPVYVNNDANCFALGEKYFGEGKGHSNMLGLIIGTGMAAGVIIQDKLYSGHNCGAGEFGMIPYLNHNYEYYCSGQFFSHIHQTNGLQLSEKAKANDPQALEIFEQYGRYLGNAISSILYAVDPACIVLGGSVSKSYPFFKDALWQQLANFAYSPTVDRLTIKASKHENIALLGAAALCLE